MMTIDQTFQLIDFLRQSGKEFIRLADRLEATPDHRTKRILEQRDEAIARGHYLLRQLEAFK